MRSLLPISWLGVTILIGGPSAPSCAGAFWKPVSAEELTLVQPKVDPEAGVEILFRDTEIDDSTDDTTLYHTYVRLKVFDARGVAALDKIEIVETRDAPIIHVAARVIQPDGTIVEVSRDSIYAREFLRHGSRRVRAKAFSFPALQPGCIVEYQWDERSENGIGGLHLYFQDRFPAWRVRFRIKPFNYDDRGYRAVLAGFRYPIPELRADAQGFYPFEQTNVPALREEPWMPPDDMVQSWMMLYFLRKGQSPEEYWRKTGRDLARETTRRTRITPGIEKLAASLAAEASDAPGRLRRFAGFCRDQIANSSDRRSDFAPAPDVAVKAKRTAADTLETRAGSAEEINLLFLALARAAGMEARLACATDRSKRMFREPLPARVMLPDTIAAVRVDGEWQFFDPGNRHLLAGWLAWENEGVTALVCDRAHSEFVQTPRRSRAASGITRGVRLTLDAAGAAIGHAVVEYRGHAAVALRQVLANLAPERRAQHVFQIEAARLDRVELGEVSFLYETEPDAPLVVSYDVRVPHYAVSTGTRLLVPLAYFQRGLAPLFAASTREHVIYLPFESSESDTVEFALPPGFVFADAAAPARFALPPAVDYRASIACSEAGDRLVFRRAVDHGGMLFPTSAYRLLKHAFDDLHHQDGLVVIAQRVKEE